MAPKRRISLDDEALQWICTGLKSVAASTGRNLERKRYLLELAARLGEGRRGNPNLMLHGQLTSPKEGEA